MTKRSLLRTTLFSLLALSASTVSAAPARALSADLGAYAGSYVWSSDYYEEGAGSITRGASITKISDTEVQFEGFCTATKPFTGTLQGDTIYIQPQEVSECDFGPLALKRCYDTGYRMKPDNNPIRVVLEDNKVKFMDYTQLVVASGTYEGLGASDTFSPFEAEKANGAMNIIYNRNLTSDTYKDGDVPVIISRDGATVKVLNFANMGGTVNIELATNGTLSIAKQKVYEADYVGEFYTYAAEYPADTYSFTNSMITGDTIFGTWTADELSWGNWIIFSTEYMRMGCPESASVRYLDGTKFSDANGIETVAREDIVRVTYTNLAGFSAETPFDGLNVVTTLYSDGSQKVTKKIFRK